MAPIHWLNKNGRTKCDQHIQTSATKRMQSSATKRIECSATSANNTVRQSAYNTVKPAQTIQLKTDNSHLNKKNMAILLAVLRRSTLSVVVWMKRKIFLIKVARMEQMDDKLTTKLRPYLLILTWRCLEDDWRNRRVPPASPLYTVSG